MLPWSEVGALVLEPPGASASSTYRLVLVPAAGVNLGVPVEYPNKADRRPSLILLDLDSVQPSADAVKQALRRYAGTRFIDKTVLQRA